MNIERIGRFARDLSRAEKSKAERGVSVAI